MRRRVLLMASEVSERDYLSSFFGAAVGLLSSFGNDARCKVVTDDIVSPIITPHHLSRAYTTNRHLNQTKRTKPSQLWREQKPRCWTT